MNWKTWLIHYSPKNWTNEEKLAFIQIDCPTVTMQDLLNVIKQ